jgi:hypothetical protein
MSAFDPKRRHWNRFFCRTLSLMRYLSLLLLGPWLVLLAWAYWAAWRRSRMTWPLRLYDTVVIAVALVAAYGCALAAYDDIVIQSVGKFGRESGNIWKQVMPALYGYGAFAAVMVPGVLVRLLFKAQKRDLLNR